MLNEISQTEKDNYCIFSVMLNLGTKRHESRSRALQEEEGDQGRGDKCMYGNVLMKPITLYN
jgi:hypothetical protein